MQKNETFPVTILNTVSIMERLFSAVNNANNGQLSLVNLYDYVDYVIKQPTTKAITDDLEEQRKEAYKTFYQLKKEALKELRKSKKILLNIISQNKLENPQLNEEVQELKRFEDGGINYGRENYEQNLESILFEICKNLLENGHGELIKQFIDDNRRPQNIYGNFVFSKSLSLFYQERKDIQHLKKIEMWQCWEKLKFVPEISRLDFSKIMQSAIHVKEDETGYFIDYLHLQQEVGKGERGYENKLAEYKNFLTRLHTYFIQKLAENTTISSQQITDDELFFYPADGQAKYRGVTDTFAVGTKGYELLNFLYTSKNTPLELRYFQDGCNMRINNEKHRFKKEKDISDTIRNIKDKLKVKKGERFPITKKGKAFRWEER